MFRWAGAHLAARNPSEASSVEEVAAPVITVITCSNTNLTSFYHPGGGALTERHGQMTVNGKMRWEVK